MKYCNFKIYVTLLLSIFIISCSNNDDVTTSKGDGNKYLNRLKLSPQELVSIIYEDGSKELAEGETLEILNDFVNMNTTKSQNSYEFEMDDKVIVNLGKVTKAKSTSSTLKVVFHKYNIKSRTKSNETDNGFALVCADKRFASVLAFVENGKLEESIETGAFMLIENAKSLALREIYTIEYLEDSLREQTINKLKKFEGSEIFDLEKSLDRIYVEGMNYDDKYTTKSWAQNPSGTFVASVGPLTSNVRWDQTYPYNMYADLAKGTDDEGLFGSSYNDYYPAGCVVIAMAQIAAYFRPAINVPKYGVINWNVALASSSVNNYQTEQAKQIAAIISAIAVGSGTKYGPNGGSTNSDKARAFMSKWGINMDNGTTCNFQNMKSSLDALRLVYTTGTCRRIGSWNSKNVSLEGLSTKAFTNGSHAWVTDGYQIRQRGSSTRQILRQYNVWSSCNFGWGGLYNGWYLFENGGGISYSVNGWEGMGPYDLFDINLQAYPNVRR